ncbi:hypothetical protein RFI_35237, partial [Reticulomyxa filosa]
MLIVGENCLKNFLKDNNNSCPIEPHDNCQYFKTKMLQKFIGNLPIMCFKQFQQDVNVWTKKETPGKIECNFKGELKDLQHHFDNECPFTLIDCWFKPFGCNHKCHKQTLNHHLISNMNFHFNLVMKLFQSMKQTIQLHQ